MDTSFLGRKSFFDSDVRKEPAPEEPAARVEPESEVDSMLRDDHTPDRQGSLSTIGKTLVFKGELSADEDLLIQGKVEGTIRQKAANLTIGAHGNVKADIDARNVIVQGEVEGDIRGEESIVVEPSARVEGNLLAPQIGLKEGAKFKGTVDMDPKAREQNSAESNAGGKSKHNRNRDNKPSGKPDQASNGGGNTVAEEKVDELLG